MKALIMYWSATGNTKKVANAIEKALIEQNVDVVVSQISETADEDLYSYNLVFIGSPSYEFLPPEPVLRFVKDKMKYHRKRGDIKMKAPKLQGKRSVVFCTYSGPHTGIDEVLPVGKYLGQFLAHIGFEVMAEWYIAGEFHNHEEMSTKGMLGDIRGRPNEQDLARVEHDVEELLKVLKSGEP